MLHFTPKELQGKISYKNNSIQPRDGIVFTEEEQKIFDKFKEEVEYSFKHRFD